MKLLKHVIATKEILILLHEQSTWTITAKILYNIQYGRKRSIVALSECALQIKTTFDSNLTRMQITILQTLEKPSRKKIYYPRHMEK